MAAVISDKRVVKSGGEVDFFDPNLIAQDCIEAGIEYWTAAEVAFEVSQRVYDGISAEEIQRITLEVLSSKFPEAAERYKRFHGMYVRTSKNTIESFDRKKIVDSLIEETSMPREIAENIARETELELRRLRLEFISAPLIREVVNVKLLEHGFEEARRDYTRLGMPVYDVGRLLESSSRVRQRISDHVLREYTLLKVLPLHIADMHMHGDFYIHSLQGYAISAQDVFISQSVNSARDVANLIAEIERLRELSTGRIYVELKGNSEAVDSLASNSEELGFIPVVHSDARLHSATEKLIVVADGDYSHLIKGSTTVLLHPSYVTRSPTAVAIKVTVNLPRIAHISKGNEREFFQELHKRLGEVRDVMLRKREMVERRLKSRLPAGTNFIYEIGFIGLEDMARIFTGEPDEAFALRVLTAMRSTLEDWRITYNMNFALSPTKSESLAKRFAGLDRGKFGRMDERAYSWEFSVEQNIEYLEQIQRRVHTPLIVKANTIGDVRELLNRGLSAEISPDTG